MLFSRCHKEQISFLSYIRGLRAVQVPSEDLQSSSNAENSSMNRQTVCCIYNWSPPNAANSLSAAKLAHCNAENSLMNRQALCCICNKRLPNAANSTYAGKWAPWISACMQRPITQPNWARSQRLKYLWNQEKILDLSEYINWLKLMCMHALCLHAQANISA